MEIHEKGVKKANGPIFAPLFGPKKTQISSKVHILSKFN